MIERVERWANRRVWRRIGGLVDEAVDAAAVFDGAHVSLTMATIEKRYGRAGLFPTTAHMCANLLGDFPDRVVAGKARFKLRDLDGAPVDVDLMDAPPEAQWACHVLVAYAGADEPAFASMVDQLPDQPANIPYLHALLRIVASNPRIRTAAS